MSLILAVHSVNSIFEYFLPGVNNRRVYVDIPATVTGNAFEMSLALEVWNGVWHLTETGGVAISKDDEAVASVVLVSGLTLFCEDRRTGCAVSVIVAENYCGYSDFDKYLLKNENVTIGRSDQNLIRYDSLNLVTGRHAAILGDAGLRTAGGPPAAHYVVDSSGNGTYVNGERIMHRRKLAFGDVIYIIGLKIVYLGDAIAVNRPPGPLRIRGLELLRQGSGTCENPSGSGTCENPSGSGTGENPSGSGTGANPSEHGTTICASEPDEYYQRSPCKIERPDNEKIEIEAPPNPVGSKRQPLIYTIGPAFTMVFPMLAGVLFMLMSVRKPDAAGAAGTPSVAGAASPFMFMGIVTSATAALFGAFWGYMNFRRAKKTETQEESGRVMLYRAYLDRIRACLTGKQTKNKEVMERANPGPDECLGIALNLNRRLWERGVNHPDFLNVRLGIGEAPSPNEIVIPKERFSLVDDALAEGPAKIKAEFETLKKVPVGISLLDNGLIGVIGEAQDACNQIARAMALQIATFHSYTDVRMAFIYRESEARFFEFAKWLPHVWNAEGRLRMLAYDANGAGEVFYDLSAVLRARFDENGAVRDQPRPSPYYVIFITDPALAENEAIMKYLTAPSPQMGVAAILAYGRIDLLPDGCSAIICDGEDYRGYYSLDGGFAGFKDLAFDAFGAEKAGAFARRLSGIRVREARAAGEAPRMLTFLDMYKTSDARSIDVERRWLENRAYESMKAMIGYRGADAPLYLDIHEKYHGPHGLVAGTTGSGKSETLQTYILSLALNYHPYEISFILIDYKGGGMASGFEGLPHIAGVITNLGGNQTGRALASINSEIKRRQATFNKYKLKHIDEYIELFRAGRADAPVPHLIIIADEFAELKKEQPDFVRELVSASRVGRSLGVHLILATQKPSGVVDDEIWGNSKFRICLRVQDKSDSNEMIKRSDAALITNAGRGYFQVGGDEIFELFQSGWSGAAYEPETGYSDAKPGEAQMIDLRGKPRVAAIASAAHSAQTATVSQADSQNTGADAAGDGGCGEAASVLHMTETKKLTQLEAVTSHIAETARALGIEAIGDIWLPPLPEFISLSEIEDFTKNAHTRGGWSQAAGELRPVVGLADDPVNQRQFAVAIDMATEGHMLVTGAGGGGKTTFLQTLLYSLAYTYSPAQLNIYIADFGSRTLDVFGALPHTGGIVFDDEGDRADKLVKMLLKELARRKLAFSEKGAATIKEYSRIYGDVPFILFAIDNYAAWNENRPGQEENLITLCREAAAYGVYLVLTCANAGDVRYKVRQNIGFGIGLQLADKYEYQEAVGVRTDVAAEGHRPGRGVICAPRPLEFQTAVCGAQGGIGTSSAGLKAEFESVAAAWSGDRAPSIPQAPSDMSLGALLRSPEFAGALHDSARHIPFAYDLDEADLLRVDLAATFCYTISGAPRSGKTNMLKTFMRLASEKGASVYVFDGAARELESYSASIGADGYATTSDELFALMENIIIPEFSRRNEKKAEFVRNGRRDADAYVASERLIFLFIGDMTAFCGAVYNSERDMKSFTEQMVAKGDGHMIYLFACLSNADMTGEYNAKRAMRGFAGWKEGLHLGGGLDDQRIFDFDVPLMERVKRLPAGYGHALADGVAKRIVTPIAEG